MSATNRGAERKPHDFYATPVDVVNNFLNNYGLPEGDILEPSAGNGNVIKAIKEGGYTNNITALEIRDEEKDKLEKIANDVVIGNFLEWNTSNTYKIIIGNPPYSLAKEFMEKCFEVVADDGIIIMLLRTAFLESKGRYEFWQQHPLSGLYVLSKRPSFTNGKTDATSYAWFVWDNRSDKQEIKVI